MKTMSCKELGGACDLKFSANNFEEIAEMSKAHGTEMYHQNEPAHLEAMAKMQELMKEPGKMMEWFEGKRKEFDSLEED